jgi:hypothetical protein
VHLKISVKKDLLLHRRWHGSFQFSLGLFIQRQRWILHTRILVSLFLYKERQQQRMILINLFLWQWRLRDQWKFGQNLPLWISQEQWCRTNLIWRDSLGDTKADLLLWRRFCSKELRYWKCSLKAPDRAQCQFIRESVHISERDEGKKTVEGVNTIRVNR